MVIEDLKSEFDSEKSACLRRLVKNEEKRV